MELLITRVVFNASNPQGEFVAGDIVEVLVETTEILVPAYFGFQGIRVKKNGNYVSSGAFIDAAPQPYKTTQSFATQVCVGTYLVRFAYLIISTYPYYTYLTEDNHPICNIGQPVCNLTVIGQPDIIPATGASEPDGSVIITATSTNPIRYKIGSDFAFADGTGQDESTFSELLPGQYRIYLVDSNNCKANVSVDIPISNVYNPIYRLEYDDIIGGKTRIDIGRRGYIGPITEVCGTETPLLLQMRGEGNDDKFTPIIATDAVVELLTSVDGQFRELYTNDPDLYQVSVSKSESGGSLDEDPLSDVPLIDWFNVQGPGAATDWTVGIPEPTVTTASVSDYLSALVSGIAPGEYLIYLRANMTAPFKAFITFRNNLSEVGRVEQNVINGQTNVLYVKISGIPDHVRLHVQMIGDVPAARRFTLQSISMPIGVNPIWRGKVIPGIIEEDYKAAPYAFTIQATDGLPRLKELFLMQSDGQRYNGKVSVIKLIALCLRKNKLALNIRAACNIYSAGMASSDADDPLDQAYVDFDLFYLYSDRPTLEDVLFLLLDTFGARILQWGGYWNIVRIEESVKEYDYRIFDADGTYVSNGTFDPVLDLGYPDDNAALMHVNADQNLEIRPGFGFIRTVYHLGYKDNILKNGDFRLKSDYNPLYNSYVISINTEGFTLYTGTRPKTVGYRNLEDGNVALTIGMPFQLDNINPGWTQSDIYSIKMGTNNQLRFYIRYACEAARAYKSTSEFVYTFGPNYVKLRIIITYGPLYLASNGTWLGDANEITILVNEYNKFQDFEILIPAPYFGAYDQFVTYPQSVIIAYGGKNWKSKRFDNVGHIPESGVWWEEITVTPTTGMDFSVRVFDADVFYSEYTSKSAFKAAPTVDRDIGYKTEIWGNEMNHPNGGIWMDYYELQEGTDSEFLPEVVRPNDYNGSTNQKIYRQVGSFYMGAYFDYQTFLIDKLQVSMLTDGKEPINTIVRDKAGEANNNGLYLKEFYIGSYSPLTVTNVYFGFDYIDSMYFKFPGTSYVFITTTESILSAELIFAGYLRSASGVGYDTWTRDGIAENDKLHGIMLRVYAAQYKKSWRRMRGSFYSNKTYFGFINVVREMNSNNRIYIPVGLSIDDKKNIYSGELLELTNIYATPGSDGSGEAPYNSGFTRGFGASGYN